MIEFKNVIKAYGRTTALNDLSLAIDQPGIYCLLGRNGAGKTTMLKTLAGHSLVLMSPRKLIAARDPMGF